MRREFAAEWQNSLPESVQAVKGVQLVSSNAISHQDEPGRICRIVFRNAARFLVHFTILSVEPRWVRIRFDTTNECVYRPALPEQTANGFARFRNESGAAMDGDYRFFLCAENALASKPGIPLMAVVHWTQRLI